MECQNIKYNWLPMWGIIGGRYIDSISCSRRLNNVSALSWRLLEKLYMLR